MIRAFLRPLKNAIQGRRSPQSVFSEVYKKKMWGGEDEFFSGYGSHIQPAIEAYVEAISRFAASYPGLKAVDLGCGDFNIGKHVMPFFKGYIACDVVPALISRNRKIFPEQEFQHLDITSSDLPAGDVALCRQVLQHLDNKQILAFLPKLIGFKYLIVTEHLPIGNFVPNSNKPLGAGIRAHQIPPSGVMLTEAPFNLKARGDVLCEIPNGETELLRTICYHLS